MLIENSDYYVRVVPFPVRKVGGMVIPNEDGTFSIFINAHLSKERQIKALKHELEHIENNDFYNGKAIREIENI